MPGTGMIILGIVIMVLATAALIAVQMIINRLG